MEANGCPIVRWLSKLFVLYLFLFNCTLRERALERGFLETEHRRSLSRARKPLLLNGFPRLMNKYQNYVTNVECCLRNLTRKSQNSSAWEIKFYKKSKLYWQIVNITISLEYKEIQPKVKANLCETNSWLFSWFFPLFLVLLLSKAHSLPI